MIWLACEVGCKKALSAGSVPILADALQRDKHRIDLRQYLWIGEIQHPSLLAFVVVQQNSQVLDFLLVPVLFSPGRVDEFALFGSLCRKVVSVKYQRLAFGIEGSGEGGLCPPLGIGIVDVNNVKIPSPDDVSYIAAAGQELPLTVQTLLLVVEFLRQVLDLIPERHQGIRIVGLGGFHAAKLFQLSSQQRLRTVRLFRLQV